MIAFIVRHKRAVALFLAAALAFAGLSVDPDAVMEALSALG